ncbi:MAG: PIN domain-containing protein [Chloroflexi bacterium]|nr:PIN domain-containing protein [Chloroflexota bacterium]
MPNEELAITSISIGELTHGAYKSANPAKNLARVDVLMAALTPLPFDQQSAHRFGQLKAELEQKRLRLADLDLQIASIALQYGVPLVSYNYSHFSRIPHLLLEDWLT